MNLEFTAWDLIDFLLNAVIDLNLHFEVCITQRHNFFVRRLGPNGF